jgi:hypothetical protein
LAATAFTFPPQTLTPLPTPTTGSANISSFDYAVNAYLHTQQITLDDASVYYNPAVPNAKINFTVTSPNGTEIHDNTDWALPDITAATPTTLTVQMPQFAGGAVQYGIYTIVGTIQDTDTEDTWTLTKTFEICKPSQCSDTQGSDGCAKVNVGVNCNEGILEIDDQTSYIYKGVSKSSVDQIIVITAPAIPPALAVSTEYNAAFFQVQILSDGLYSFAVLNTAAYNFGDSIYVHVAYTQNFTKWVYCNLDLCWAFCGLKELKADYDSFVGSGSPRAAQLKIKLDDATVLITEILLGMKCGYDVSSQVTELKAIFGGNCQCVCGSRANSRGLVLPAGTTFVFNKTCADSDLTLSVTQVGSTYYFNYEDVSYLVESDTAGALFTPATAGCVKRYTLVISVDDFPITEEYEINTVEIVDGGLVETTDTVAVGSTVSTLFGTINAALQALGENLVTAYNNLITAEADIVLLQAAPTWAAVSIDATKFNAVQGLRVSKSVQGNVWLHGILQVVNTPVTGSITITSAPIGATYWPTIGQLQSGLSVSAGTGFNISVSAAGVITITPVNSGSISVAQVIPISMIYPTN